jgi:hypothetical protein
MIKLCEPLCLLCVSPCNKKYYTEVHGEITEVHRENSCKLIILTIKHKKKKKNILIKSNNFLLICAFVLKIFSIFGLYY